MSKVGRNAQIPGVLPMSDISREAKFRRGVSRVVVATISVAMIAFGYLSLIINPLGLPMLALGLMGLCAVCIPGKPYKNDSVIYVENNTNSVSSFVFDSPVRGDYYADSNVSSGRSVFAAEPTQVSYGLPAGAPPGTRRQN